MKKNFVLIFVSLFVLIVSASNYAIIEVKLDDISQISQLNQLGYEITNVDSKKIELVIPKKDIDLLSKKYSLIVKYQDADQIFSQFKNRNMRDESVYHTYSEMNFLLDQFVKDYPDLCKKINIGKSYEERDIIGLKISDNPEIDENEPSALFMGAHHAREWISIEVPLAIAQYLLENYKYNKNVKKYIEDYEIFIIPMINPDGVEYSMNEYSYWRKTRRHISGNTYGVDPNRNYGYHWGETGASSSPWNDTYKGEKAFSEKCTQALRDFALWRKFDVSISYHSYGGEILYPYSYSSYVDAPDAKILKEIAEGMGKQNGYNAIKSAALYPAAGDSDDWLYTEIGTFAFTFELGKSFIPKDELVDGICEKNIKSAIYLLDKIPYILDYKSNI